MRTLLQIVILALCAMLAIAAQDPLTQPLNSMASRLDDAIDQAMIPLNDAFMLNGTHHAKSLRSQLLAFKATLMPRLKGDMKTVLTDFVASRKVNSTDLTEDEKALILEKTQSAWTASYNTELNIWSTTRFQRWVLKSKEIWHGIEDKLARRIQKMKKMFQRSDQ